MALPDWMEEFLRPLEVEQIPYAVTGSVASMVYGEIRLTADIDIVIWITPEDLPKLRNAFPQPNFYLPDQQTITASFHSPNGGFNVIHQPTGYKADFYIGSHRPIEQWVFDHRRRFTFESFAFVAVPPEYIIAKKLEFYREGKSSKHLRDIRAILMAKVPLDQLALDRLIDDKNLRREWNEAKSETR